jgi:hypothetical protein
MAKKHIFDAGIDLKKAEIANAAFQNLFIFPTSPVPGQVVYRSDLNIGAYWDATTWIYFGLPEDIRDALFNANAPDAGNPFATLDDIPIVPEDFLDLLDVPNAYTGAALKAVRVKGTEDGLEFFLIVGIPAGGTTGQVLGKASATDYDVSWITPTGGGGADANAVHYDAADGKTGAEKQRARDNIGSSEGLIQTINSVNGTFIVARTNNLIEITGTVSFTAISGFDNPVDGEIVGVINRLTAGTCRIFSGVASSDAILLPPEVIGGQYYLDLNEAVLLRYNGSISRWEWAFHQYSGTIRSGRVGQLLSYPGAGSIPSNLLTIEAVSAGSRALFALKNLQTTVNKGFLKFYDFDNTVLYNFTEAAAAVPSTLSSLGGAVTTNVRNLERWTNNSSTGAINNLSLTDTTLTTLVFLGAAPDLSGVIHLTELGGWRKFRFRFQNGGVVRNQSALSTTTNRFNLIGAADLVVPALGWIDIEYTQGSRWEITASNFPIGGGGGGVNSVTGDGVGGTATDPILTFPTPAAIGAEAAFTKGNIVAGANVSLTGSGVGRLVGPGDLVIASTGGGGGGVAVENAGSRLYLFNNY